MTTAKKILIDARFWQPRHGGLSKYTQGLILHLSKIDRHTRFIILTYSQKPKLPSNFTVVPVRIPHYSVAEQTSLPFIIQKLKPDLIHFLHFNHPLFCPIPFIVTIHDLIKHHFPTAKDTTKNPFIFKLKRLAYHLTIRRALFSSQSIITPSQFVKNDILKLFPQLSSNKITPIYEGVFFNQPIIPIKKPLPKNYLLYVGSLYQHKNLKFLIDNLNIILNHGLNLVIVTPKPPPPAWTALINRHRITYFSSLSQGALLYLYKNSYAFISASLMEGFGLPAVEAMSFDKPLILSSIPAFKEITHNQQVYFDLSPNSLDQALAKLKRGYKHYQKTSQNLKNYYSFRSTAVKTLKLYQKFL
ncbi:MAG: glycosyltransferase family 4 protein [bacterium]|nr:glycosyltransferase family 4 protein [bacterium]